MRHSWNIVADEDLMPPGICSVGTADDDKKSYENHQMQQGDGRPKRGHPGMDKPFKDKNPGLYKGATGRGDAALGKDPPDAAVPTLE